MSRFWSVLFFVIAAACHQPPLARHGCTQCHAPNQSGIGPSWREVAGAYCREENGAIARFLNGETDSRIKKNQASAMGPILERTKRLRPGQRLEIERWILEEGDCVPKTPVTGDGIG